MSGQHKRLRSAANSSGVDAPHQGKLTESDAPTAGRSRSSRSGSYSGISSNIVGQLPKPIRTFLGEAGGMIQLLGKVIASAVREPKGYWTDTINYSYMTLKKCWLPSMTAVGGFVTFISIAGLVFLNQLGGIAIYAPVIFRVTVESFCAWAVALVLAGIVGAALTSELGARKVRDELSAMSVMGIDPVRELVLPRVMSAVLLTTFLGFPSVLLALLAMSVTGHYYGHQTYAQFFHTLFDNMVPMELYLVIGNCFLAGVVIGIVCAYKGLNASGGAEGLGRAVNQAVVYSFVVLWIYQTIYSGLTQGVFDLGRFR